MNQYRFVFDEAYVVGSADSYRRQKRVYPWFVMVKVICALGLSLLIAAIAYGTFLSGGRLAPLVLVVHVLGTFMFLLVLGPRIDYLFLKRRLKQSPFYGDETLIEVSEAGVSVNTQRSQTMLQWSAFSTARRIADGFLVFTEPKAFLWWPDTALAVGSVADVERLLCIRLHRCAEVPRR